jgi:hypothetical protein
MQLDQVPLDKLDEDKLLVWHLHNVQQIVGLSVRKEAVNLKVEVFIRWGWIFA